MKLRSCMTLFHRAAPDDPVFARVLDRYFDGVPDAATDALLASGVLTRSMSADSTIPTADAFIARLTGEASEAERIKYRRYFPERHQEFIGVRMGTVFAAAKANAGMELDQIERLLEHDAHEVRAGAVRIMAEQAKARATTDERRQALAALYLRRHDRIDDWDLVDLGAWEVLGRSLVDRPRDVLDELAAIRRSVATTLGDHRDLRLHPARRAGRHVPDRRAPAR